MAAAPLSAEGFGRRYRRGAPWAVRDLSLEIPRGSITALVGPNGAGKSTLIRSWMGFERPDEGRVLVDGLDVAQNRAGAVAKVGYVPQGSTLYRNLSVADHFALAHSYRPGFDRRFARERVEEAGVAERRRVGELSGGEQAQVALALALGTGAPVLLLDEPLASLDPLARREFLAVLVNHVRSSDRTAVLSSHIVTDVEQACDQLIVLAGGRLLLQTSVAEARSRHRTLSDTSPTDHVIGRFTDPEGKPVALVESEDTSAAPATLDDIVLGYLASQRSRGTN